jgi:pSer/pThr/pTyr-binding forkhead associated (FHA) protein
VVVVILEATAAGAPLELSFDDGEHIGIGRHPRSRVQLPDASVSLNHAVIRPGASGGHVLVDQTSTNGSFVNGVRLVPGASKLLADGDEIDIGRARLRVRFAAAPAPNAGFSTQDIALAMVQGALIASGSAVAPRLRVTQGPDRGLDLLLDEERSYILGRDAAADLRLVDEQAASRHTRVVRRGSRLWVVDLGSKSGTRLDGRQLRANVAEAWADTCVLELGGNQLSIDDPVSSALRSLERVPDEKLGAEWSTLNTSSSRSVGSRLSVSPPLEARTRRSGGSSVAEKKGHFALSTSSSSSAPSAPIEVLQFRQSETPKRQEAQRPAWSVLDALVVGVAVVTVALSALALAWFIAN